MATKKQPTEKIYAIIDSDEYAIKIGTLSDLKDTIEELYEDDNLEEFVICELGPKKKITFIPGSIKIS